MTLSFQKASDFNRITKELEKLNSGNNNRTNPEEEKTYWQPAVGKDGNGYAVIRFLPAPEVDGEEGTSFVYLRSFGFEGPTGRWYIENSRLTLGEPDPVEESNSRHWKMGEAGQKIARARGARKQYISNVLVIEDKANPEAVGHVFRFRYGKKIMNKLDAAMKPQFEDETPLNPFDLINGANFKLKIKTVEGYRNYDASEFAAPGRPVNTKGKAMTDDELQTVYEQAYSLKELIDPSRFKSYDELKRSFESVVGVEDFDNTVVPAKVVKNTAVSNKPTAKPDIDDEIPDFHKDSAVETANDDDLEYFRKLAADDDETPF